MQKRALTLYTLREHCKTAADLETTLKRVKEFGYHAVQISGINFANVPIEDVKRLCDEVGLPIIASHDGLDAVENNFDNLVHKLKTFDCPFTAVGAVPQDLRNAESHPSVIKRLIAAADKLAEVGIGFGYHNHSFEFRRYGTSTYLDAIYDQSKGTKLLAELDLFWVAKGGGDPIAWINKVAGRMPVVHIKDYALDNESNPHFCEIGEGNLNWPGIFEALDKTNVRWYIVEQDAPVPGRDIFESVKISCDNLKKFGVA